MSAIEEAKKRDHRKLGKDLQLFHVDEDVGQGLIPLDTSGRSCSNLPPRFHF